MDSPDLSYLVYKYQQQPITKDVVVTVFSGLSNVPTDPTDRNYIDDDNYKKALIIEEKTKSECNIIGKMLAEKNINMVCAGDKGGAQGFLLKAYNDEMKTKQEQKSHVIGITAALFEPFLSDELEGNKEHKAKILNKEQNEKIINLNGVDIKIPIVYGYPRHTEQDREYYAMRKNMLKKLSTFGYIVLPGGPGTFAELWDVVGEKNENFNGGNKNIVVVNINGFFEPLKAEIEKLTTEWGTYDKNRKLIIFIEKAEQLRTILDEYMNPAPAPAQGGKRRSKKKHHKIYRNKSKKSRG